MTDSRHPEVVVGAFIRDFRGRLLLVKSYKWPGLWVVGGGHVEYQETIAAALQREVLEEYSLHVHFVRIIKTIEFINHPQFVKSGKHFIGLQCECLAIDPAELKLDQDELTESQWFTLKAACKLTNVVDITLETIKEMYATEHL